MQIMRFQLACLVLLTAAIQARAQDAAIAPASAYSLSGNVALTSDYLFRGLTQTWGSPAIQGGGDLTLANGFAAGLWASSVSQKTYPGAALELDLYASYGSSFNEDWSWRAGLYRYIYPNGNLDAAGLPPRSFDTLEANAALTWKWLTLKYSHALTDYFGIDTEQGYRSDSKGTGYVQLDAAVPVGESWSVALHAAHTDIPTSLATPLANGASNPSYSDFGATLKWQFATHWNASVGMTYANNDAFYSRTADLSNVENTRDVGGTRGFVMLQGTL
ncbi:MAG TPA: TorF family putative porin [Tepidisphaeraceae bacterium]|nr:TorF family putative porin [Tepidisphaeraceae bacterium]